MASNRKKVTIEIGAENKTQRALNAIAGKFSKIDKVMTKIGRNATAKVTAPITAGFFGATREAVKFEKVMLDVGKNVNGLDATKAQELEKQILKSGASSLIGAEGIARLVSEGGKLGKTTEQALMFAKSAEEIAVAFDFGTDLAGVEEAGRLIGKLESGFGITTAAVRTLADDINFFADNTASNARNITDILVRQGAVVASSTGLQRKEIAALAATIDAAAPSPEIAATAMKNFALALTAGGAATRKQSEAFHDLGFDTEDLAKKMQVDAKGAILEVLGSFKKLDADKQGVAIRQIFGKESLGGIAPLVENIDALATNFERAGSASASGSVSREVERLNNADSSKLTKGLNAIKAASVSIGQIILPPLAELATKIVEVASNFQAWGESNPMLLKVGVAIAGIAAAFGPLFLILGQVAGGMGVVMSIFGFLSGSVLPALGAAIAGISLPITLVVAAIVGAGVLIYQNWETIKMWAMDFVNYIVGAFNGWKERNADTLAGISASWESIKESASRIWNKVSAVFTKVTTAVVSKLNEWLEPIGGLSGAWEIFKGIIVGVWDAVGNIISVVIDTITGVIGGFITFFSEMFETVADVVTGQISLWEGFKQMFTSWRKFVSGVLDTINEAIFEAFDIDLIQIGKDIINGLIDGLMAGAVWVKDSIAGIASDISSGFKDFFGIKSPSRLFKSYGKNIVQGLAIGLVSTSGMAVNASENLAVQTLEAFNKKMESQPLSLADKVNELVGGSGIDAGGFSGDISGGLDTSGGIGSENGFEKANGHAQELDELRKFYDERLLILKEKGLAETDVFSQVEAKKKEATQANMKLQLSSYSSGFSQILAASEQFAGKQSGIYKVMFAASKAFALSEATVSGFLAVQKALASAPFPANVPAVALASASTAANIAGITGSALSFEGGGFTGAGARTGGLDGKGGFMAMVHPNESVTDHTKDGNSNGAVNVNITITGDATNETIDRLRTEIKADVLTAFSEGKRRGDKRFS